VSGKCPECGEPAYECICDELKKRDKHRALLQEFINLNDFSAYDSVLMFYDYIIFIFLTNVDEGKWSREGAIKHLKNMQDSGLKSLREDDLK
jgi:hypothetical protein